MYAIVNENRVKKINSDDERLDQVPAETNKKVFTAQRDSDQQSHPLGV